MASVTITSTVFSNINQRIYYASKKYNSEESYLSTLTTADMRVINTVQLTANESTPILALDHGTDTIYIATAGFNNILKYSTDLKIQGIAVLPDMLKQVSSMYYNVGFLYMVTSEPNAVLGRITDINFCPTFCGIYAYCEGTTKSCVCIQDYVKNPRNPAECAPFHYVQNELIVISEQTTAAAFGVLFAFAIIAGIAGWFLWFRVQSTYSSSSKI